MFYKANWTKSIINLKNLHNIEYVKPCASNGYIIISMRNIQEKQSSIDGYVDIVKYVKTQILRNNSNITIIPVNKTILALRFLITIILRNL